MGIFDFLKKKNGGNKNGDELSRIVTHAQNPEEIPQDKRQEDLKALSSFEGKIEDVEESISSDNPSSTEKSVFSIKNPFVGE